MVKRGFREFSCAGRGESSRFGLARTRLLAIVSLLFCAGVLGVPLSARAQSQPKAQVQPGARPLPRSHAQADDYYWSIDGRVNVKIALDQLGILVKHGVTEKSVALFADSLGLGPVSPLGDFIFILGSFHPMTRGALVSRIRDVERQSTQIIAEAGMVVTIERSKSPILVTDKFIAQFRPGVSMDDISGLNQVNRVHVLEANVLAPNHFLLEVSDSSDGDAITMSNRYHDRHGPVRYAHPNWIHNLRFRQYVPRDQYYENQWHHDNRGWTQDRGTLDADIDTPLAWEITRRISAGPGLRIAVIDAGFDLQHPDLAGNLCGSPGSQCYDYLACDGQAGTDCGDDNPQWEPGSSQDYDDHGTPVAGLVGAVWDNNMNAAGVAKGLVGACPTANLILIRRGFDEEHLARAFQFAHAKGAAVITASWGDYNKDPRTATLHEAIEGVVKPADISAGSVVLFSMDYAGDWGCERDGEEDLADMSSVIAVSGSSNRDRRLLEAACGDYLDVLAPSSRGYGLSGIPFVGTLNVATDDVTGARAYNSDDWQRIDGCPSPKEPSSDPSVTYCFTGTSAAAPIAAGVVGLILKARPGTRPEEVQRLLQDTADKIEDSEAKYDGETGFSTPVPLPSTHGFGRINAYEAVRVAAPVNIGGKGGTDLFVRDNRLDWGNTEQPSTILFEVKNPETESGNVRGFIGQWTSPDIKVDAKPFHGEPKSSEAFDKLDDEEVVSRASEGEKNNRVYVRVRNRGPGEASEVRVKLYYAPASTVLPAFPGDFWTSFETNNFSAGDWHMIDQLDRLVVPYSGSTAARDDRKSGGADEPFTLATFEFEGPSATTSAGGHYAILAIIDSPVDPVLPRSPGRASSPDDLLPDLITSLDNNIAYKNLRVVKITGGTSSHSEDVLLRNPSPTTAIDALVRIDLPAGWILQTANSAVYTRECVAPACTPISLPAGQSVTVSMTLEAPSGNTAATVTVTQESVDAATGKKTAVGGLTIQYKRGG